MSQSEKTEVLQESEIISSAVKHQFLYNFLNAQILPYPYPHFYIENVFPEDFYQRLLDALPSLDLYTPLGEMTERMNTNANPNRFCFKPTEENLDRLDEASRETMKCLFEDIFKDGKVVRTILKKIAPFVEDKPGKVHVDRLLVKDLKGYKIGPHTDSPQRIVSMLFYLPKDDSLKHTGTSIYVPRIPYKCEGGPHYEFKDFYRVKTVDFKPNSALVFVKGDKSFHGVEMLDEDMERDVILVDFQRFPESFEDKLDEEAIADL